MDVTINRDENKFLLARNGMKYFWLFYILFILGLLSKILSRQLHLASDVVLEYQMIFFAPFILYFLYYLTIGRKKYLILEEDHENIFNS